jgi:hypothetical protein
VNLAAAAVAESAPTAGARAAAARKARKTIADARAVVKDAHAAPHVQARVLAVSASRGRRQRSSSRRWR